MGVMAMNASTNDKNDDNTAGAELRHVVLKCGLVVLVAESTSMVWFNADSPIMSSALVPLGMTLHVSPSR